MDISDIEGDRNSQIHTVPVTFGKKAALALSALTWTIALVSSLSFLWNGAAVQYLAPIVGANVAKPIACFILMFVMCPVYFRMWKGLKSNFDKKLNADLIGEILIVIGKGLILLTLLG